MHVRGKDMTYIAHYPDGTYETLLSVPKYDFNWQITYELAKPKLLPKGTKVEVIAHYDNSTGNKFNPGSDEGRALGRSDVGRDDDRLLLDGGRAAGGGRGDASALEVRSEKRSQKFKFRTSTSNFNF